MDKNKCGISYNGIVFNHKNEKVLTDVTIQVHIENIMLQQRKPAQKVI
jgi:hypothetical protein